jgi:ribosomal protein S18 acetylase RimI-like enzyme
LAEDKRSREPVGYVISFQRRAFGYVSVLAVVPRARRQCVGLALLSTAVQYLGSLGLATINVDVPTDNALAVSLYQTFGFEIAKSFVDETTP